MKLELEKEFEARLEKRMKAKIYEKDLQIKEKDAQLQHSEDIRKLL